MKHNTTRDQTVKEKDNCKGADPELREIPLPDTGNILYTILNSLNSNIANFYTYTKFEKYISEKTLDLELLKRSMGIHRDFSALFLHTKAELVFLYPDFLERTEKLLFRGEAGSDFIKYTSRMCKVIKDYKTVLHREGYLPDLKMQLLLTNI
jgi:hypothetical protein